MVVIEKDKNRTKVSLNKNILEIKYGGEYKPMKKIAGFLITATVLAFLGSVSVKAGEVDILVDKLVEKGVLTQGDAQQIITETQEEIRREVAAGESSSLPAWVQKIKFKGDFRLRYQWTKKENHQERHRGRYRLRAGVEAKVIDDVEVGFGLCTGGSDPRSTNQTFCNSFETPDIRLDYAFAEYTPWDWLTITGGKFKNPFWNPSGLLWDSDIRPEGAAFKLTHKAYDYLDLFLNSGFLVLDESSGDASDPIMYVIQPGFKWKVMDDVTLKTAGTYYGTNGVKGKTLAHSSGTNSTLGGGGLRHNYNIVNISSELAFDNLLDLDLPRIACIGEYVNNIDASDNDYGVLTGLKVGAKKVKKKGQWQAKYLYRWLEKDAWLDIFPNSDAYGGDTGIKGHNIGLTYGLLDNVTLAFSYYYMEPIHKIAGHKDPESVFQSDINFKF